MTSHLGFLWQIIGTILGFASIALLIGLYLGSKRPAAILVAVSVLAQTARTIVFSLANYSRLSSFGILSATFERMAISGFVYIILVFLSAYALFAGVYAHRSPGYGRVIPIGYWSLFSLDLVMIILVMVGIPIDLASKWFFSPPVLFDLPFAFAKAFLAVACAYLLLRSRREGKGASPLFSAGVAIILVSQLADFSVRFVDALLPYTLILFELSYFAGVFCLIFAFKADHARDIAPVRGGTVPGLFRQRYGLDDAELKLLEAILSGSSNKEIAFREKLGLSAVKHRLYALYRKIGVSSRYELMALANKR